MIHNSTPSFTRMPFLIRWVLLLLVFQTASAQAPIITFFNPTSGPVGTSVTIDGSNFNATASQNIVFFGATKATVTAASSTSLTVTVPAGSSYEPITVLNEATFLMGYYPAPFTTTFTPNKGKITNDDIEPKVNFAGFAEIITSGDFDGDGKADLAVSNSNTATVYRNTAVSGSITASSFDAPVSFPVAIGSTGIAVGDLDDDGKLDIVLVNYSTNNISVLRNTSSGVGNISFAPWVAYATGTLPYRVAIGDVDGDGKADIAVANSLANTVSVLRNISSGSGDINFDTKIDFAVGIKTLGVAFGDIDGDGKIDIVTANGNNTEPISVLLSTSTIGVISFSAPVGLNTGYSASNVAIGDLNNDGKPDLAVANVDGNFVSVFPNASSGIGNISFDPKIDLATTSGINDVAIADIDGDGKPDLAASSVSTSLVVFHNTGAVGGAISFGAAVNFINNENATAITIDDLDGDGKNDIATANYITNDNISVFRNNPLLAPTVQATNVTFSGTTGTTTTASWTNGNGSSRAVFIYAGASGNPEPVDFTTYTANNTLGTGTQIGTSGWYCVYNGTGTTVDITGLTPETTYQVMTVEYNGSVAGNEMYLSTISTGNAAEVTTTAIIGAGAVPTISSFSPTSGPVGTTVIITGANFSATANQNIVFFGATKATVTVATTTSLTVTVPVGATYQPISVLNGATVLVGYSAIPFITTFTPNKGNITTDDIKPLVNFTTATEPFSVVVMDFDGDGKIDIATGNYNGNSISVFRNTSVSGSITASSFAAKVDFQVTLPRGVAAGDFDGDGKPDIAVTSSSTNSVVIFKNTSSGVGNINFVNQLSVPTGTGPFTVAIGDIDYDGKPDLAVTNNSTTTISVMRNTSSGIGVFSFAGKIDFTVGTAPYGISLADMDGDGKVDVVVPLANAVGSVAVLRNTSTSGTINFEAPVSFSVEGSPFYLAIGDLNKDGKADIAVANGGSSLVSVLQNTSSGIGNINFAPKINFTTIPTATTVAFSDMDGDGNPDMVLASNNGILSFFHNASPVGGTISFGNRVDFANSNNARAMAIADFDGDGKNDVLTGNNGSNNISVFRNDPLLAPTIQATNIVFTGTTGTATTASWTNGNGSSRAVFMYAGSSGSPVPVNFTTYTANAAFGAGTQIGTTGWYCVYKGTGSTVNITGLTSGLTYQLMTVEYNGSTAGNEVYFSAVSTGNPVGLTTTDGTAPGGVAGEAVWYKANKGITLNANNVSQWSDFSGSSNNAIQTTAVSQPLYETNSINFNEAVTFSGSNFLTAPVNNLPSGNNPRSIFIVATSTNTQVAASWVYGYGGSSPGAAFNIGKVTTANTLYASGLLRDAQSTADFWAANIPKLGTVTYSAPTVSFFDAGASIGTASQASWNTVLTPNSGRIGAFVNSSAEFWSGTIAEIIYYPSLVTGNAAISIESYLAIKYGIHKTGNYLNSAGAIVWDATANAVYHNDVFGVGKDDLSGLSQGLSNSMNTGDGGGMGQSGKGNIVMNATSLANNTFVIIGHDTNALSEIIVPLTADLNIKRIQRIWKVQTTGTPGTVSLNYDLNGLTYSTLSSSNYFILVDPTGLGNFTGGSVVKYPATMISANKVIFRNLVFPTGAVFTIQTLASPTVQAKNISFANTTGTTTIASWTKGNGTSRAVFIYAGATGSPVPVNNTSYTANTVFGTGTQIGTTGWYCVYNGTGTTVNVTGLTPATAYQVMTVEYNGTSGNELYLTTTATGNPAAVTTLSNVATLSNLSISQGTLNPVFASGTTSYTATVANAITSLTLTPVTTDANATVTVNGTAVTSGNASGAIALAVGPNVITTIVTAQDGTTLDTYTVTVTRTAPPSIATTGTLSALTTTYGTPSASGTFNISGTNMFEGIVVTPPSGFEVSSDNNTFTNTITIGAAGTIVSTPVYIRLKGTIPTGNYSGDIVLTSNSATTVNVATVLSTVNKAGLTITADDQTKAYETVNPAFTATYTGFVNGDTVTALTTPPIFNTTAITGSAVGIYPITPSGAVSSNYDFTYVGGNLSVTPVILTITAENKSKAYGDANPTLTATYTGFVNGDSQAVLTTAPTITTTAVTGSPVGTYPITASGAVAANYTFNYVDGILTVTPLTDATLSNLTISSGTLTPAFASGTTSYTATVTNAIASITVTPFTTDPNATVTVNGTAVTSGSPSGTIALAVGPNVITTVVTAQDGTTLETYTITVTRTAAPTVQATNVIFTTTTGTTTTANWTNGNGSARAVFMYAGASGSPVPVDHTTYTANAAFGTGTQIGTTGWYCVYNGTGTTVNITGLAPVTTYQLMVVEYNDSVGNELYLSTISTGNPANVNTLNPTILGPGGVSGNIKLWLKANASVTPATQGAAVTTWNDQSGGNNNAAYATPIFAQTVLNPTYQLNALNFNPTLRFAGTSITNFSAIGGNLTPALTSNNISAYTVFLMNTATSGSGRIFLISQTSTTSDFQNQAGADLMSKNGNNVIYQRNSIQGSSVGSVINKPVITSTHFTTGNQGLIEFNGNSFTAKTFTTAAFNSGYYRLGLSTSGTVEWLNGDIAEVILFDADQSSLAGHNQIESYLALKYGIHKTGSYVNSSGTTIWDATANAAYHNDVFGIGQDDASGLLQTQSNSVNTGSGNGTGQNGRGNIIISNPSSLVNNGVLMIGHNTSLLNEIDVTTGGNYTKRVQRIWKAQTTGTPGNITVTYDVTGMIYSAQSFSDYVLLVDPTGTGNFTPASVIQYPAASMTGNKVSFNDVALPTGSVFTFQTLSEPIIQASNLIFTDTTSTTTTVTWENGDGSARAVFVYQGSGGSPFPVDDVTYTPDTVFGAGSQIGTSGWYCVYNDTGTTVDITGLIPGTTYQVMTVEYDGDPGNEGYQTAINTGNPASVTTLNNVATLSNLSISEGTLDPVFSSGTTTYTATVANAITSLTLTPVTTDPNATVTVNGIPVNSGDASGAIALAVGPNVITIVVTAEDGTTTETYTTTVTRTAPPTIATTGTLSALTTTYGTLSASTTFNVSGTDMFEGIVVTAPSGFEVSSDNITFTNTITIGAAGTIASTPVYIRLQGTIPAGDYSGNIILTSNSAADVNVPTVLSTVNKAPLTITAHNVPKIYGAAIPALTATYTGFVNGDTEADLTTPAIITTIADASSPVGLYPITVSGATSPNYTITFTDGILGISPVNLAVIADSQTKTYGAANPPLTITYTGFVNGDTEADLVTPATATTTADINSPVGSYPITASGATSPNYTIGYTPGATLTITPANLQVTADDQSKTYGSANPTLTATYTGFVNGDTEADLATPITIATLADASSPLGTYPITVSGAASPNYTISYTDGTLTVTTATLTITANNASKTYGSANPTLTASYSGFVNGDTEADLTSPAIITTVADTSSPVGLYAITISGAAAANYTIIYTDGILGITPANLAISPNNQTKIYGAANPTLTATYTGFVNGDTEADLATPALISTTADASSPVGSYPITASGATSPNYTIGYTPGATLTITPASLLITADNQTKTYGSDNPTLTVTYSGFVNGDDETDLATPATISTVADTASPVGNYAITASGAVSPNYTINYVAGNLAVTAATLTITADDQTKTYGSANPALTATYTGFVNGDNEADLTTPTAISTVADATSPVGNYAITASGADSPNYTINYVAGNLAVTSAILTITADDQTKTYGSANPALTASYSGFVNGDTESSLTTPATISTVADTASPVGNYAITASGADSPNYTINFVAGNLAVTAATLTITADDQTKTYGSANPALTATYTGFVNGDDETDLTTPVTISTVADTTSPVGNYSITASGADSPNYTINYVAGNLAVTAATLTITADDQTKTYGSANPALTASYSGFVNGDDAADLTTPPVIATTADINSPVGSYPITASGAVSDNYTFDYVAGSLTVTPVILTVTADNQTKTYGSANPTLTVTYSGFVNGDDAVDLATPPVIVTTADINSPVGSYPITASGAVSDNYTFDYIAGSLTVTPVTLTVTADNQTKTYGSANPTLTVTYSGFVNGDDAADLATPPVIVTTADINSPVGSYPIIASGAVSDNYTFDYIAGSLTVTPVTLTITADDQTKTYGSANPTLTVTYSGFVNGDDAADLATPPVIVTTADINSPVGSYPITASGAVSDNYTFDYIAGSLTVTPVTLTITADDQTKTYGSANPTLTVTYSGFVNGDDATDLTTPPIIATTADLNSPVGSYPITASGAVSDNYTFDYVAGSLTVTPVTLTVTADNQTKTYGSANPTLTVTYSGFVNGDDTTDLATPPVIATTANLNSPVGSYPITASGAVSDNYTFDYVAGSLTVTPVTLTVTADNQTKTYGSANPTLTVTYSGFVNGDDEADLATPAVIATTADLNSPVGSYPITASGAVSDNYTFDYIAGSLTVTPVILTVTADDQTKTYGSANPTLTVTYSGFVNGDDETDLATPPVIATTADLNSPVGSYPITASGAVSDNYTFDYVAGSLTVTPVILTVTADNQTKTYGSANPTLTVTYSGFVNGDDATDLTTPPVIATTADLNSPVGSYPITASGAVSDNYTFDYVAGSLTVTPVTLTVTADNQTKTYGSANPTLTVTYSGFVNGDDETDLATPPVIVTTADINSPVGSYPITASGAVSNNYTFDYIAGSLTVTPVTLTVTADNQTKTYGSANPTLTVTYSGFVNGDDEADLTTPPVIATTADLNSPVGSYPITASGAVSDNYTFDYIAGSLTVTPVTLTVTADNQTKTYGSANPTLTVTYSGFVNGDDATDLTTPPVIATTANLNSHVGSYPITASGAVSDNYTFDYIAGSLTVTPVILTVTADNQTKTYGSANPTLTVTYSGFVNGDDEADLTTPPVIATTANLNSHVGSYPITASGAVSDNYTFDYIAGSLTVTPVILTVTADNQTKTYGSANPTLTVTYSGFVNGDDEADLTTPPVIATTDLNSPVGSYPITVSGAVSDNYTFDYVAGNLTVTPVTLTVTADNQTKTYGSANPTLTVTYSGFVNGDDAADLTTPAVIATTADLNSPVGSYPITASGAVSDNYTFDYIAGSLTVTPVILTVTADNQTKTYGSANPTLTVTYSGFVNGDDATDLTTPPVIATTADLNSPVGSYPITASGAVSDNYTFDYVAGNLTVTPVTLTVTADNQTKTYGSANPTLTVTYSGFVNGDDQTDLTIPPVIATTADLNSPVGTYPITASGAVSDNYTFDYVAGNLTVTPVTLTVTADNQTKTYGSANPTLTVTYSGFVNGDDAADLTTPPVIATTADLNSPVGSYPITASGAVSNNYTFDYIAGSLTVTPVILTVTADNQTKTYGSANPTLTVTYSGFVNGDDATDLTTPPVIATTADLNSPVGSYPITASGAVSNNYTFDYIAGSLTVTPVILTVTADNQTKTYGSANPTLTVTYSGFVNGDDATDLTTPPVIATTADLNSPVGSYPITASGAVSDNYTFDYVAGNLTVTPVTLTVTADNQTKTYGSANPTLTVTYSGFVNGDDQTDLTIPPVIATTADLNSPVGSYPITASGAVSNNYTFDYIAGSLTVTPVILTVTADNQTKTYGSANPTLTVTYSGFVNGDDATDLTTPPVIATTADLNSPVGSYPITASGAVSDNYTFDYVAGNLTVTPVTLTVTADNQTKTYGSANPTLTVTYSGFVNGDDQTDLTIPPVIATTADLNSPVGTYPITASGAVSDNYTFDYVAGNLTVTPVTLTVTADNQTKTYGSANPTLTVTYSGFVNGDDATDLATPPVIVTTADINSPVGSYPIIASGAVSNNYTFDYIAGSLTVTPVILTVTADNQTKTYGSANPTLTVTYSGFVNGDDATDLATPPVIVTTADINSPVGSYPIIASGAVSNNYTFDYIAGSLTVTPVILTVTADNQTKTYGSANPTLTVTYSGFVNGDDAADLTTPPVIATTADINSPVGSYPIIASGAVSNNYTFDYIAGSLTVTPVILTVTADNQTKTYGSANPVLTASYSGFVNGDTEASLTTPATISTVADTASSVGTYPITASGAVSSNYDFTYVDGILTVTPLTDATLSDLTISSGTLTPAFAPGTTNYTATVDNATTSITVTPVTKDSNATVTVNGIPVISGSASDAIALAVGTNVITIVVTAQDGTTLETYTVTVTRTAAPTIVTTGTLPALTTTYGTPSASGTFNVSGTDMLEGIVVTTPSGFEVSSDDVNFSNTITIGAAGTIPSTPVYIRLIGTPAGDYSGDIILTSNSAADVNVPTVLSTVNKATLTITADDQTKVYGSANPAFTATYSGFVNGDSEADLTTPATISTLADTASPVGTYPITASGAVSSNYDFIYVAGILTVTPLTDATLSDLTISSGTLTPAFAPGITNYTATVDNATTSITVIPVTADSNATVTVNGVPVISGSASDAIALAVGPNVITIVVTAQDGTTLETYTVTVTRTAAPTILTTGTLSALTTTYGTPSASGTFNVSGTDMLEGIVVTTPSGFEVSSDDINFSNTITIGAAGTIAATAVYIRLKGTPAGDYSGDIILTSNSAADVNVPTVLSTVNKATLTITADNQTKVYGSANPVLTATYSGFVNGETEVDLTTPATISTLADTASPVGTYPITASGAVSSNYDFIYVAGILTVTPLTDATLSDLTISSGTLTPAFAPGITNYTATVDNATTSITVIPVTADSNATVTVNGIPVISESASDAIALVVGPNVITTVVTAQDGTTLETYTITVTRTAAPTIATTGILSALTTTYGTPSASGTFNVSGTDMLEGILVTAPSGFEVSNDDITFTNAITIGAAGTIASTPVYIRLKGTPTGDYSGDIILTSNSAPDVNVPTVLSTVNKATLTITADNQTKVYGSANPALTATYSGFVNGDDATDLTTPPVIATTADLNSPVGSYPITASRAVSSNYDFIYVNGILTVTPLTDATLSNLTISSGTLTPAFAPGTTNYTATVDNATTSITVTPVTTDSNATVTVNGVPVISGSASDAIPLVVGPNVITTVVTAQDGTTLETYTVTVTRTGAPTIVTTGTLSALTTTYGTPSASGTFSVSGTDMLEGIVVNAPSGFEVSSDDVNFSNTITIGAAGTIAATPVYIRLIGTPAGDYSGDITLTSNSAADVNVPTVLSTVNKATLTITADNQTKVYGDINPAFTATYTGFVNGDSTADLTTAPTLTTTADVNSPVGTYPITASGAVSLNYDFTYVDGILTVTPLTDATLSDLTISSGTLTPAFAPGTTNYTATVDNATTSITLTPVTTDPNATVTVNGVPVISGSASDAIALAVGTNVITTVVTAQDGTTLETYTITVTRTAAPVLTITVDNKTKNYGDANPTLTVTYSGFVNGDTVASLTTLPTITTTANTPSSVGTYPITASGAVAPNYTINYVNGTLTVTKATLNIAANNASKVYGSVNPALTATYTGFVNGDTSASLTTLPTITTTAVTGSSVGTYPITASGAVSSNYTINYVNGTLTVTKATLKIAANNASKVYGSVNPTLTATYTGFVNGDTSASLTTLPIISTTAITGSSVGTYPISASGAVAANYTIIYGANGTLTITPVTLTIKADNKTKVVGSANPALTATYTGFVNGDTVASLTTTPTITTTAVTSSPAGTYPIKANGAASINYTFVYIDGILTVLPSTAIKDNLINLAISNGTLSPAFSPNITSYSTNVGNEITTEIITPTAEDPLATITVNGVPVISGQPSNPIPLAVGSNPIIVKVTGNDGLPAKTDAVIVKTYTVIVNRAPAPSSEAGLANLIVSNVTLNPQFAADINNYVAEVANTINTTNIKPTLIDPTATITINGTPVSNNGTISVPLNVGDNTITVVVTAQDGVTQETYTINIYRAVGPDAIVINNIISPNGDGKNDYWEIKDIQLYPNNKVIVFDRAGRIIYSKTTYANDWDGSYAGSRLNDDTYYYLIDLGDGSPRIKGFITMIRD